MKYYCTVTLEADYVVEADSVEEASEAAWAEAFEARSQHAIVKVEVQDL
jgi:hypothetical protein